MRRVLGESGGGARMALGAGGADVLFGELGVRVGNRQDVVVAVAVITGGHVGGGVRVGGGVSRPSYSGPHTGFATGQRGVSRPSYSGPRSIGTVRGGASISRSVGVSHAAPVTHAGGGGSFHGGGGGGGHGGGGHGGRR